MSIQQGIRLYKEQGKESELKEIRNLMNNDCFSETNYDRLTKEEKDKMLPILMFNIQEKWVTEYHRSIKW